MKGEQMMMTNKKIKINGCTPIEDLITEDFGAIGKMCIRDRYIWW